MSVIKRRHGAEALEQGWQVIASMPARAEWWRSSRSGTCRPRATRSRSSLRDWWYRRQRRESRIPVPGRGPAAPRAPSGDWRRGRWSARCGAREIPEVHPVAVPVGEQVFGNDAVLELRRQPPFARHHVVARQVPPEIVVELLRAAIDLPAPENLEGLAVHDEDAGRAFGAVRPAAAERADVDALGAAMHGVRPGVARLSKHLLRLDHLVDLGLVGCGLGIDDVDARRAHARE